MKAAASNVSSGLVRSGGAFLGRIEKTYTITIASSGDVGVASFDWSDNLGQGASGLTTGADVSLADGLLLLFEDGDTAPSAPVAGFWVASKKPIPSRSPAAAMWAWPASIGATVRARAPAV